MIDEELYKIATDELNSDARKPDVWARACALASDDHDEARFLYTNLRVEEMLNKDGKQRTFSRDQARDDSGDKVGQHDDQDNLDTSATLNADLIDFEIADTSQKDSAPISSRTGVTSKSEPLPIDDILEYDADQADAPHTSVAGNAVDTNDAAAFDDESLAELDALSNENAKDDVALSGLTGKPVIQSSSELTSTGSEKDDTHETLLTRTADTARANKAPPETERAAELSAEPERQADGMDSTQDAMEAQTIDKEPAQQLQHDLAGDEPEKTQFSTNVPTSAVPIGTVPATRRTTPQRNESSIAADYAGTDILDEEEADTIIDLGTGHGPSFALFNRQGDIKAVKRGVSWPALLFTFPWLLSKAMIGTALIYACLWIISIGGVLISSSTWLNAGDTASLGIKIWTAAFALLAIVGLLYIPFRYGNRWVAEKLQNRGFDLEATINASNKRDAVDRLLDSSSNLEV